MSRLSTVLFEYRHDGWVIKGVRTWDNRFLLMRRNPMKNTWHKFKEVKDETELNKFRRNNEV